jgi:hypothetical protein
MGPTGLLPFRRKACWWFIFFALKNSDGFGAGLNPRTLGSKGQQSTSRPPKRLCYYTLLMETGREMSALHNSSQNFILPKWVNSCMCTHNMHSFKLKLINDILLKANYCYYITVFNVPLIFKNSQTHVNNNPPPVLHQNQYKRKYLFF